MSTQIFYGNSGVLAYPTGQPCPLFGESDNMVRYGGSARWTVNKVITLQGSLSGCTYSTILNEKAKLERIYSRDFQPLRIVEQGNTIYYSEANLIRGIEFQQSKYIGLIDYSVTLEAYPRDLTSGVAGVLNPINEWSFNETENQLLEATHRVSAKGINTASGLSNAFDNAKNYVLSLTGTSNWVSPYFINYCTGATLCLDTIKEDNINRFEQTYGITETYILDLYHGGGGYIRYSVNYECNVLTALATLNLNGEVKSCKNSDLATLRSKYSSFNPFSAAVTAYQEACGRTDLNPDANSFGLTEDPYSKKIAFNYSYDNDFNPKVYFEYSTDSKIDENDITTVEVKGVIKGRGDLKTRWSAVENFYNSLNLFTLAAQAYNDFVGIVVYPLNPKQLSFSLSKNQFISEISLAASYNNKTLSSNKFQDLDYSIAIVPAVNRVKSLALVNLPGSSCNSFWYSVFLGFASRSQISINGRAVGACSNSSYNSTLAEIKNVVNGELLNLYSANGTFLEKNNVSQSNESHGNGIKFQFDWSMQSPPINPSPAFDTISTLLLK